MKRLLFIAPIALISLVSCKKEIYGCTDKTAANYSDVATDDDGSCIAPYVPYTPTQQVFVEEFTMTFSPSSSFDYYQPSFNYEYGDIIVLEALSDDAGTYYWSSMPFVTSDIVFWGEYGEFDGDIWVYSDYVSTGDPVIWTGTVNLLFRAALVKKKTTEQHPNISDMTITEISKLK